ncbi:MAG: hypothetical protein G01um101425_671 [Candidatus Peregrinibacteria bacterium Gr01-1014_25]|nr:MAG: hypothetical protein G01um101425_671 [Candidatus Peregrinibacteria bacterium Gr01-1014_25]
MLREPVRTVQAWSKGAVNNVGRSLRTIVWDAPTRASKRSKSFIGKSMDATTGMVTAAATETLRLSLAATMRIGIDTVHSISGLLGRTARIGGRAIAQNARIVLLSSPGAARDVRSPA